MKTDEELDKELQNLIKQRQREEAEYKEAIEDLTEKITALRKEKWFQKFLQQIKDILNE